jgi:nucleotide sugar dehydrogenase
MGIDVLEVIKAAATKPFGYMPFYPGCGVGGHCIPVDPYYLIEAAKAIGFDSKFMSLAREINQSMPKYTMSKLITALNAAGLCIRGTKIAVLGISYKGNVGDIRESPAKVIVELIKDYGAEIEIYDPFVPELSTVSSLEDAIKAEAIIIATDHDLFKGITGKALAEAGVKVVIDGKNCLDKEDIIDNNIIYNGIGR